MRSLILTYFLLIISLAVVAQNGHEIKVTINGQTDGDLYLAYNLMDTQYVKDTVSANADGVYVFKGEESLPPGVYLVAVPPENNYFQILITEKEQHFSITTDINELDDVKFEGKAAENRLFYKYLGYLEKKQVEAQELQQQMTEAMGDGQKLAKLQEQEQALNDEVLAYQRQLIKENPNTFTATLVKANLQIEVPEFEGTEDEVQTQQWRYYQAHYFDNLNLADPQLLRTPFLFTRVDYFVNKLQVQHPDTIAKAIDHVLEMMRPSEETFKSYVIHFVNQFAKSKIVGMDAVYVHLVDKYYASGQADWTDEETLNKMIENANRLKPLLLSKVAPDIKLQNSKGVSLRLHDVSADYTVLYFWRPDCSQCPEESEVLKSIHERYKDQGLQVFAVCTKSGNEVQSCWDYAEANDIDDWIHVADANGDSEFRELYDHKVTPMIYLLSKDKKIMSKRISAEQVEELLKHELGESD